MRFIFVALTLTVLAFSTPASATLYLENASVRDETDQTKHQILELLDFRSFAKKAIKELRDQTGLGDPLHADQLESFHQNILARSQLKEELVGKIGPYLELVNHPERVHSDVDLFHYLETMAIGYMLADNYQDITESLQDNDLFRHVANEENSGFGKPKNLLRKTVKNFYSVRFHRPMLRGARRFDELGRNLDQAVLDEPELRFFWTVVETSGTFRYLRKQNDFERVVYDVRFFFRKVLGAKKIFRDIFRDSLEDTVFGLSKIFGNTIGLFQSRHGYLYQSPALEADLLAKLRPGDVLLEKTPFRLTDKFIPGYWGHNAIWLGTEDELKSLGLWDHPKIQPLQARIHDGKSIVEALRPGVTTNRLAHFMDIDSFAILRRPALTTDELKRAIIRAASQYGKAYDFGFDVETQNTLVCSEMMFMTYTDIPFKLEKILGRYTINPDAVAQAAIDGPLDVVTLIVDGHFEFGDLRQAMRDLLKSK